MDAVEECAAMVKHMMKTAGGKQALVGKIYDLPKAYRQLAIREDHLRLGWIAAWSLQNGCPMLFMMESLPFGGSSCSGRLLEDF